jgi:hypothetical protein
MRHPGRPCWPVGHVERRPIDANALPDFFAKWREASVTAPERIVRRRNDRTQLVPARGKPSRHLAAELADTGRLRREIQAIEQEAHCIEPDQRVCVKRRS